MLLLMIAAMFSSFKLVSSGIAADLNASFEELAAMTGFVSATGGPLAACVRAAGCLGTYRTTDPDRSPLHCFSVVHLRDLNLFFCRRGLKFRRGAPTGRS
jgi:hypothetical protein